MNRLGCAALPATPEVLPSELDSPVFGQDRLLQPFDETVGPRHGRTRCAYGRCRAFRSQSYAVELLSAPHDTQAHGQYAVVRVIRFSPQSFHWPGTDSRNDRTDGLLAVHRCQDYYESDTLGRLFASPWSHARTWLCRLRNRHARHSRNALGGEGWC